MLRQKRVVEVVVVVVVEVVSASAATRMLQGEKGESFLYGGHSTAARGGLFL